MNAKRYSRYRGPGGGGGKVLWVIALCLALLAAVVFLLGQRYLVYDDEGNVHWSFPFAQHDGEPVDPADVRIERQDPEPAQSRREMAELHARQLENGALWWRTDYVLSRLEEGMVVEVKTSGGGLRYGTSVTTPAGVVVEQGPTRSNLVTLLQSEHYAVARIHCFCDTAYARAVPGMALTTADGQLWYDGEGRAWLDPATTGALAYLTALCQELAELGFDELLLDDFSYPAAGAVSAIALPEDTDKTAILTDFAAALRKALPETVALSVAIHADVGESADASGLTAELLYRGFDRIYADETVNAAALTALLPETFDAASELAVLTYGDPQSGSYVLLS